MTDVEKQKIEAEIDELRSRIRSQLAQEHNWAEQERNWQAQQQNWQAQQQNWQAVEKLNSVRNYILVAGIAAATGATLGVALMGALL